MKNLFNYIKNVAKLLSIHPNEEWVRNYIVKVLKTMEKKYKLDEFGDSYILSDKKADILLSARMDKQELPSCEDLGAEVRGKLDDAVGIGIILSLIETTAKNTDFYGALNFYVFLSVDEEGGLRGSQYAIENDLLPKVENAIIVDTSPLGEIGEGPIIYTSLGNRRPSIDFLDGILKVASSLEIVVHPIDGVVNDGVNISKAIPNTIAIEPHVDNFHTSNEVAAKKDVIDVYKIIEHYLKRGI